MKKIIFTILYFTFTLSTAFAQKGIDFRHTYPGGGKLLMYLDSGAKNVYYWNVYPNQPNTSFSYLPDVNNLSLQINFRKNINVPNFRYTILLDNKPFVVNKSIDEKQLKEVDRGEGDVFRTNSLGIFPIKDKIITVLVYDIENPAVIDKSVFYGKPIPKAKIKGFAKRFKSGKGVEYERITNPKEKTELNLSENDDELTIVKDRSAIDYLYSTIIKDKQTNKTVFESTTWEYGGLIEDHQYLPHLKINTNIFNNSGDYEIIIQPSIKWDNCRNCDISQKEIEKYTTSYTLSVTLNDENYSKKDLITYGLIISAIFGALGGAAFTYIKKKQAKKILAQYKEKEIVELQLNSIRSQLNPHFLFNSLAGIQNLVNKNEIDNANKYLSKFARLTRNILNNKDLISLAQEKALLDDYLQMEQLRFGFKYEIKVAQNLDLENIEIPSMLLQPFVENAVKHGIAAKTADGNIAISFNKKDKNLQLTIADNGKGFNADKNHEGLGLSLSKNRISLLNNMYKETPFVLDINSDATGTKIRLTLTDWL